MVAFRYHFLHFCPLRQAFLTSNILTWGLSCLTAENAVWSCFGIILEQFIWTTLTAPIIPFKIPCHLQHLFPECEQFRDAVTDFILHSQRAFSARIEVPCDLIQVHTDLSICPHQTLLWSSIFVTFRSKNSLCMSCFKWRLPTIIRMGTDMIIPYAHISPDCFIQTFRTGKTVRID